MIEALANHLWQSTLFAGVAGLLTLALRKNAAQVRYCVWLAASAKFLVPFSLLVLAGSQFERHAPNVAAPSGIPLMIERVNEPFAAQISPASASAPHPLPPDIPFVPILIAVWATGSTALVSSWWLRWRRVQAAVRAASPVPLAAGVPALSSPSFVEPGVFGVFRQVLLLPDGVASHLSPAELQAIVAHELCHVRRRDNLAAAMHMAVEALFWFHPLVWWLGARIVEERERACDDEVLRSGSAPEAYAEGILKICELYLQSPLKCVAGVTGANLKRRIEAILNRRPSLNLSLAKKAGLAFTGGIAIAIPVILGITNAPLLRARVRAVQSRETFSMPLFPPPVRLTAPPPPPPSGRRVLLAQNRSVAPLRPAPRASFEVASIRPAAPGRAVPSRGSALPAPPPPPGGSGCVPSWTTEADRIAFACISLKQLLLDAFAVPAARLTAPDWADTDTFDISARMPNGATQDELPGMFLSLLEDRFGLGFHLETREKTVNALVVAKGGLKMNPAAPNSPPPTWVTAAVAAKAHASFSSFGLLSIPMPNSTEGMFESPDTGFVRRWEAGGPGGITHYEAPSITSEGIAALLKLAGPGMDPAVGMIDMTGLKGRYQAQFDVNVAEVLDVIRTAAPGDRVAQLQDAWLGAVRDGLKKLGLQLEPRRAPVQVVVVDRLEKTAAAN